MRGATILVSGTLGGAAAQGGLTWVALHWLLGLRRLGYDAWLVEPVEPSGDAPLDRSTEAAYFERVVRAFGLEGRAALLRAGTRETVGVPYRELLEAARRAELVVNLSGILSDEVLLAPAPRRLYVDLDPAFTQLWAIQRIDMRLDGHTHFATVGLALGTPECPIPTLGRAWIPTLPPVVSHEWGPAGTPTIEAFTTIANWRGYGSIEHEGVFYGQKAHSLRPLIDLPARTAEGFVLALSIHPDEAGDLAALRSHGWRLVDPGRVAGGPGRYRDFVRGSKAEFGIAKSGYVAARSAWFSDRSACYLASGRPVVAQDTGFGRALPTGEGLFAFSTAEDVLAAIDAINADYPRHADAARAIAEAHLDSDRVLPALLDRVGLG
jgi:hypothetical protein